MIGVVLAGARDQQDVISLVIGVLLNKRGYSGARFIERRNVAFREPLGRQNNLE